MKNKRILAALLSATMIFSSVPYTVLANSPNASSESVFTTSDSSDSDETKNDGETTDTTFSDSSNDGTSDAHDSTSDDTHDTTGDQSVVSSSSTSSTAEKPAIEDVHFKIKGNDKSDQDKDIVIPLVYNESVCDPSDLIQPIGVQDTDTVSYTVNDKTWEEPKTKTPFAVGEYKISVKVSRSGYQDRIETATFSIKAADLDKETYEKKFTAANVLYDGAAHELLTASDLASDDVVSYVMDGKESDKIPSATDPGQYSITVKIKKGSTEKEQANYNQLSLSFVATIERDVAADVQYASPARTENNTLYYKQNAEVTFSLTTKDFDSKLANVKVSKDDGDYQDISNLAWEKKGESDQVYTAKYTISESGSYRFRISYQNVSGKAETRYETDDDTLKKIVIDTDKPVIELSYDKSDLPVSATSFPYRRKATITVRDDNLAATPASINVQAANVKDGSAVSDAYEIGAWQKSSDGTYTCEVSFQQDAEYSLKISAEDLSGNASEVSDKFIIDTTKPKISISYDNNNSQNDSYFNSDRTMTLTVSDDEVDYNTLSLPVTVNGDSVSMTLSGLQNGDYEKYGIVLKQFVKEQGELVLSFGKTDNAVFDYTVSASVKDKAGHFSEAVTYADGTTGKDHFIIDEAKPVMSVSAQSAKTYLPLSTDEKNPSYATNPVTLSLDASDAYFDMSSVSAELTQTDANGKTVHAYKLPDLTSDWKQEGDTWKITLPVFENDANYSLKISCKDKAGNVSGTYGPYYFTIDQTAPIGKLSISDGTDTSVFQKLSDTLRYWIFKKSPVTINGTAEDATSGLSTAEYMVYAPDQTNDSFSGLTYEQLASMDADTWKTWTGSATINASEKGFLYLKLTDKAGNVSFVNTSDGIIVDDGTSVGVQITPQMEVPKNGIYKTDVPFKINVTAPENDKTFTGIRHVDWRVEANGKTTQSGNYDSETDTDANRSAILRQFSHSETVKSSLNNSNDVKVFVSVEDWAGNRKETSISLAIDTTDPKISASYDNNNVKNNLYYNTDRNMALTVQERNFSEDDLVLPLQIGKDKVTVTMQDIRDGKYGLTMVTDRVDSEENTGSDAYTDDRTNTYVIGFGHAKDCDEDFKVSAQVSDLAGNETNQIQFADGNKATNAFTIDKIKPVIHVTAKTESSPAWSLSTDKNTPPYSRESVTLSVSVTERNFEASGASESLTQTDAGGKTVSAYILPNLAKGWTQKDTVHTFVLPDFTKDANYGYDFAYTDLAGNTAEAYPTQYFTVDKTAPEGSLSVSDKGESSLFDKLSDLIRYWFFDRDSVKITGSSKDQTSGLVSVTSYLFNPESDESGEFSGPTYDELLQMDSSKWKPWTGSAVINKNEKGFLYLRMEDKAGNISFVNTSDGVIVSSQADLSIKVTPKANPSSDGIYANDVPFQISVKAPTDDPLFTGIRYVKWQVVKDGKVTQSGNYNNITDGDTHRANRLRTLEKSEVVSAEKNNSNHVLIQVTAEDWAGNTSSVFLPLSIDVTKPTVTASYDNNDAKHEKYFNSQRDMTLTVQERNFSEDDLTLPMQIGKDKVTVTMQDIRDGKYGLTMVSDRVDSEKNTSSDAYTDERANTYIIGFGHADNSDEDFNLSANVVDGAGNTSDGITFAKGTNAPTAFTIDKVAPVLTITANNDGTTISLSKDKKVPLYTRSDVTLTAAVDERNFDTNGTDLDITQTDYNRKELSVYEKPDLTKGWKTDGGTHTLELPVFSNDANYGVSFAYTDLAGNQAVAYPAHYFTIDKTVPTGTLTIRDDDETSLFDKLTEKIRFWIFRNHSISVEGKSEDATSGIHSVSYLIYDPGTEAKDEFQGLSYTQLTSQTGWKPWNGSVSIDPDQAGFVYLRMEDMAGNVAFINTSDGMIAETQAADRIQIQLLSDPTSDGVYNSDVPFEISVADPVSGDTYSGLRHVSWEITNGKTVTQKGNYDSETDGDANRSKRIDSLTKRETVSAEKNNGNDIQIHVYTEDWAGNKAEKSLSLIIDTTKPEISMSYDNQDVHNGKYYNKDRNMTLTIQERNFKEVGISLPIVVDGQSYNVSMQDIRNGRLGLVMVSDAHDSQSGFSKEEWTDDRTVTYIIGFGHASNTDDDYTVSANAEDMAANQNIESGESFTIDKIAPIIAVSLTSGSGTLDPSTDAYNPAYARSAVQAEVTIDERNFDGKDASAQVTQKNAEGKDLSVYSVPDVRKGWTSQNGTNHYTFPTFSNDANYSLSLSYTDLAGNQAVPYAPHYFTVDQTAPVGSLTTGTKGESSIFNTLANLIRFWFYNNTAIPVSGTYRDETAGIASASYLIYEPGENSKGTFNGLTTSELNNLGGWQSWNGSTIVAPNKGAFVYVKLVDRAGNVNYLNTSNGVVADNVAPSKINIELLATPSNQNIFNTDVPFKVTAADPSSGGTYAGLKHVTWQVLNNGAVTQSGNFDNNLGDRTARVQSITGTAKVEASRNNSNRVTIRVRTEDWAGNTAETTKDLAIDITKPKIEIIYDHNNPVNGKYYNQTRVATVRVTERNFDPSKVNLKITSTGQKPSISGWTISPQAGSSDNAVNTCTITFSADADYTLNASVTDKAGNVSDYNRTDTFTIDQTRPKISVTYSGGNVRNGKYFDQKRTATITVTEHNFDPSQFRISIQAALDGKDIDKPVLSSWTSRGDTHTASVTFLHDGDYSFTAETGDLAGNRSDKYTQSSFTIDTKAPELSFFDIKDHSANKDTVAPGIRSTDLNFDFSAVTLTLKGAKHKEKTVQGTVSDTANGVSIKLSDFAHNKQTDDIYTLTAMIQDKAGNVIEKSIVFSVNRYGSNFTYGKKTVERLDKYYLSKSSKLVIYETNVDQIVDSEIVVLKDGTSTTLKKGSDYTVDDESEMNGWHKYKYTISDHCFSEEGLYEIQIRTSDKAGNIQDNKIKNSPIRFVIDRTAPTAVVTGVVNNGRYKELSRKIYVQVTDNYAYGSVSLYLGDHKVKSFDAETVAKKDGKLSYTLKSANGWQRIRVEYNDLAGNHGNPVSMRVLVSASTWQQILYSEWFMPTIVAIFGGIVFLIILILLQNRKKKKSAEKA